jgi:hypothetical protein
MQQGAQVVVVVWGPEEMDRFGGFGLGLQATQAFGVEGVQRVADRRGGTAQGGGDMGGTLTLVAGQEDLAAAQGEGIRRAEALLEGQPLGFGLRPDEQRWFPTSFYAPDILAKGVA